MNEALLAAQLINAALNVIAQYRVVIGDVNARLDAIDGGGPPINASEVKEKFGDLQAEIDAGRALD